MCKTLMSWSVAFYGKRHRQLFHYFCWLSMKNATFDVMTKNDMTNHCFKDQMSKIVLDEIIYHVNRTLTPPVLKLNKKMGITTPGHHRMKHLLKHRTAVRNHAPSWLVCCMAVVAQLAWSGAHCFLLACRLLSVCTAKYAEVVRCQPIFQVNFRGLFLYGSPWHCMMFLWSNYCIFWNCFYSSGPQLSFVWHDNKSESFFNEISLYCYQVKIHRY